MNRIQSVDAIRLISIAAVIIIHTEPFRGAAPFGSTFDAGLIADLLARFAVPCFFVLSGFFWARKFGEGSSPVMPSCRMAGRIAVLLLFWSVIYLLPTNLQQVMEVGLQGVPGLMRANVARLLASPVTLALQSTKTHLWFLIALLWCLAICGGMLAMRLKKSLIALSLLLFGTGLLGGAYADTPIGFHVSFSFRNGPFFGPVLFTTGYLLQRRGPRASWLWYGVGLTGAGACLQLIELKILNAHWGTNLHQDFALATYFYGLGVAMIGLSGTRLLDHPLVSRIGPLVLGIYAIHVLFVDLLKPFNARFVGDIWWDCTYPLMVFLLSTLAAFALSRHQATRPLVM